MKKEKWSDYASYLVLSDKSTFVTEGESYKRKITSSEAKTILDNINEVRWTPNMEKIFLLSNQLRILI